ncbi:MAG: hypothetical protein U1F76_19805 [Candidatus Competibacteraceae bacterium]
MARSVGRGDAMWLCPVCGRELTTAPLCKCGADLGLLQQIRARADHLFNQALAAYEEGQIDRALEYLEANAVLVPLDVEARVVQTKLLARLGRWGEVKSIVALIQNVEPAHLELALLHEMLAEVDGGQK